MVDEIMARIEGSMIDFDAPIVIPSDDWDLACLIGKTVSLAVNGFEDNFDGMDWEDAAYELRQAMLEGVAIDTRRKIIKLLLDCEYNLLDYC